MKKLMTKKFDNEKINDKKLNKKIDDLINEKLMKN